MTSASTAGLPELSPRRWRGGANGGSDQSGEWHATGGFTYVMALTNWPALGQRSFSPFICEPQENCPVQVRAKLSCSGRYGAALSIEVDQHWFGGLNFYWKGRCSVVSAKRRGLAHLYDLQEEFVRTALESYYGGRVCGHRTDVFDEQGGHIATFVNTSDAFNCELLPTRFYTRSLRRNGALWVSWCRRDGSTRSSSSGPDMAERLASLICLRQSSEQELGKACISG